MNKAYKEGRKTVRLNRDIRVLGEDEELQNKIWQQQRLIEYYNSMPIMQFMFKSMEADDVIAYICRLEQFGEWQKVIISSDKDFFQLLDDKTVVYRPIQKQVLNKKYILDEFGVHPNNFALARAMAGDRSDNLPGVKGVGVKTAAKRFPFLSEEKTATIPELISYAKEQSRETKLKLYPSVVEGENVILSNYQIMQLYTPTLSVDAKREVRHTCAEADLGFNQTEINKMMLQDGFGEINFQELFAAFKRIALSSR